MVEVGRVHTRFQDIFSSVHTERAEGTVLPSVEVDEDRSLVPTVVLEVLV